MPQRVKAARLVLFLLPGFLIVLSLAALAQADAAQRALDPYSGSSGFMAPVVQEAEQEAALRMAAAQFAMVQAVIHGAVALLLAACFGRGRNALRIGTVVYGAWLSAVGTFMLALTASSVPATTVMAALLQLAAGVLLIVLMVQKDGVAWFNRPRH
jgi:hypothetical protein